MTKAINSYEYQLDKNQVQSLILQIRIQQKSKSTKIRNK
ncbi:unnamed protein product [Paramecium octaurelia]|uniref:Uncharacterized protein n=1 Tax=Paramecium octaurelia TaxID=43137 RepID=A0A8S1VUC6_PAROT|nr:unnamed protein product [Paramecium octaurelia]